MTTMLALENFTREEVDALNSFYGSAGARAFEFQGAPRYLSFDGEARDLTYRFSLRRDAGGSEVWLSLDSLPLANRIEELSAGMALDQLPRELAAAVVEAAFEPILEAVEAVIDVPLAIREVRLGAAEKTENGRGIPFRVTREDLNTIARGRLYVSGGELETVLNVLDGFERVDSIGVDDLPVPLRIEAGSTRLSVADCSTIEEGDIVVMDESPLVQDNCLRLRVPSGPVILVRLEDRTLTVIAASEFSMTDIDAAPSDEGQSPSEEEQSPAEEPLVTDTGELPIELVFELGRQTIALSELKAIVPGYTFNLEKDLSQPVTIRANGQTVGSGKLVQVDDRIGVRVTELFGKK